MTAQLRKTPELKEGAAGPLSETLLYRLRRVQQRAAAIFAECVGEVQVTPTQWSVLLTLKSHAALSQNQLGRLTHMDPATTQGVIVRLIERSLVERRPDPADRRRASVSLTKAGQAFVADFSAAAAAANDRALDRLSAAERQTLMGLLEKLM